MGVRPIVFLFHFCPSVLYGHSELELSGNFLTMTNIYIETLLTLLTGESRWCIRYDLSFGRGYVLVWADNA